MLGLKHIFFIKEAVPHRCGCMEIVVISGEFQSHVLGIFDLKIKLLPKSNTVLSCHLSVEQLKCDQAKLRCATSDSEDLIPKSKIVH